ncbi:MAG TPA: hypothetical protein VHF87_18480 [Methylomirabilota bacterium]|nr:hypothetical protein [Methylomirabilota bacterium]
MSFARRLLRIAALAFAFAAVVAGLTWALERVMPPSFSGFLALVLVGLAVTEFLKRQPRQRALRMFRLYLHARERGADEPSARARLLARLCRDPEQRQRLEREIEAAWTGASEKERAVGGIALLLAREKRPIEPALLSDPYDRARDQFTIGGWDALPLEFTQAIRSQLERSELQRLDELVERHRLFQQKFFKRPTSLGLDPARGVVEFARLLQSLGNHLAHETPGDAERAYRLSLRLRPDENLAHAGLALLLDRTGRTREAGQEAKIGLEVLDGYAARAAERNPTTEDISPFRSPASLREALERVAASA